MYATFDVRNPLFSGFSSYASVNKEIGIYTFKYVSGQFNTIYYNPGQLFWVVFMNKDCKNAIINIDNAIIKSYNTRYNDEN